MDAANRPDYFLQPGYIYFSKTPAVVRTVVGSCVAVCIWDKKLQCGGMNHFLRPWTRDADEATPQYGNVATAALIKIMEDAGCQRQNMVAQITGGAVPDGIEGAGIGSGNVEVAREILTRKGIALVSEDTGGKMGRKLIYDTFTGQLVVLKVHKIRRSDWVYE